MYVFNHKVLNLPLIEIKNNMLYWCFICYSTYIVYFTLNFVFYIMLQNINCFFYFRGAGQEVGRSCIVMEFKGKKIMASPRFYL